MTDNLVEKIAFDLYSLCWSFALPWLRWSGRLSEGFQQRILKSKLPLVDLWIQAASVGESSLAMELIKTLNVDKPLNILVTTNTKQGFDILNQRLADQQIDNRQICSHVGYFPFDKPSIMERAVRNIAPKVVVLLETEIWPGLLRALKNYKCKTLIINGRMTDKSLKRYLLWPSIWQKLRPDKVIAISQNDADRFGQLFGQERIEVMPNIKFDCIASSTFSDGDKNKLKNIVPHNIPFVVLASIRRQEEHLVKKIVQEVFRSRPETVIGLFPRHMHRIQFWQNTLRQISIPCSLRSKTNSNVRAGTVVLWDTFGELLHAYKLSRSAFVGGSLAPLGGQNFLEALVSGVLPIIGPSWHNFAWVGPEIIDSGLLRVAGDWKEVAALLNDMDSSPSREEVIDAALQFIKERQGGTAQACRDITACLYNN